MFKNLCLIFLVLLFAVCEAYGQTVDDIKVEMEVRYWASDLDSRARVLGGLHEATEFDVKNDLGLKDKGVPQFRFAARVAPFGIGNA